MLVSIPILLYLLLMLYIAFRVNKKKETQITLRKNIILEVVTWVELS